MAAKSPPSAGVAPLWSLSLPVAYAVHLCEEWWGGPGFPAWTQATLGAEVSQHRFLLINAIALPLFSIGSIAAVRSSRFSWLAAAFSALVLLNGSLHVLATVAFATYSPGTLTGAFLYLPLGGLVLVSMSRSLTQRAFTFAVLAGIAVHAMVAAIAFA